MVVAVAVDSRNFGSCGASTAEQACRKLGAERIVTVRGMGYRLDDGL
jgi:hypothetical protein